MVLVSDEVGFAEFAVFNRVEYFVDQLFGRVLVKVAARVVDYDRAAGAHVETTGHGDLNAVEHAVLDFALGVREQGDGFFVAADALELASGAGAAADE